MRILFVATLLATAFNLCTAQPVSISDRVTVTLPATPEIQRVENKTFYLINETNYHISVMTTDMRHNPEFDVRPDQLDNFYKGVVTGTLAGSEDANLVSERPVTFGAFKGREIRFTADVAGIDDVIITKQILLLDNILYVFNLLDLSRKGQQEAEQKLFGSIAVH